MKYQVLTVRDRAAVVYGAPFFSSSVGAGIRSFGDEINRKDPNNMWNKHPEDFDLYHLGTYDDASGTFQVETPRQIAIGKDLVKAPAADTNQLQIPFNGADAINYGGTQ